ncbi:MAG: histidine phosphatase family protein [Gammaproteobacteria bacterium]|nr:histidine phosphatase family protein [Gammaproteobacteria bacterium]
MSRELMLLRHGKSDWDAGAATDFERPLAPRGRKAVKRMGQWLRAQDLIPDYIISSPAERARHTTRRLCRFAKISDSRIAWEPNIYETDLDALLAVIAHCSRDWSRVLLVGHNPGLEYLVRYLADESIKNWDAHNLMPTTALAQLEMPDDWTQLAPGSARIIAITRARELPDT